MKKRFSTRVTFDGSKVLQWQATLTDNLTGMKFATNEETKNDAMVWLLYTKYLCAKGKETPDGWVLN